MQTYSAGVDRNVRLMADHGSEVRYEHAVIGWNSRLDTLQAVVLSAKLRHLAGSVASLGCRPGTATSAKPGPVWVNSLRKG